MRRMTFSSNLFNSFNPSLGAYFTLSKTIITSSKGRYKIEMKKSRRARGIVMYRANWIANQRNVNPRIRAPTR